MRVLVVGGGITGLAAAWEAVCGAEGRPPAEVLLVEASDRFGGKLHTEQVDGFLIEHGPDSFVSYRPAAAHLAGELGLGDEVVGTIGERSVSLRVGGRLRPLPSGMGMVLPNRLWPFVTTGILSPAHKLRAGLDLVLPRQLRPGVDVSIGHFLRSRLGEGVVRRFADPMLGGIYGAGVDELSLDATLPSLRTDEQAHRSLMLAALAQGRRTRAAGRGPASPFRTLRRGMGSLVDAVVAGLVAADAELRPGTRVVELQAHGTGARAVLSDGTTQTVDAVVLAGGSASTAHLLAGPAPDAARAVAAIPLATSNVVSLAYPADAFAAPVTTHGWLEGDPAPISGVTVSSAKWAGRAPVDQVLVRAFVPERLGPIAAAPRDELLASVTAHVGGVLGARGEPTLTRLARWRRLMPKYTVGHPGRVAATEAGLAHLPSWRIAGSTLRGVGVPDCVSDGRRQAGLALGQVAAKVGS